MTPPMPLGHSDAGDVFVARLLALAKVAEQSFDFSRRLLADGLSLLRAEFGGVLNDKDEEVDAIYELVEVELLKERFGSVRVFRGGEFRSIGYRSEALDALLLNAGVSREQLDNLSRSRVVDARIDAQPWGRRYRREALEKWRSSEQSAVIAAEKARHAALERPRFAPDEKVLFHAFSRTLGELGFQKAKKTYGKWTHVFTNAAEVGDDHALEVSIDINKTPITTVPVMVGARLMPGIRESLVPHDLVPKFREGGLFKLIEPIVPNFGLYRTAIDADQVQLMQYAYECFFRVVVPNIVNELVASSELNGTSG